MNHPHIDLGDLVYGVRDRADEDWNGPSVTAWNNAVMNAERALKPPENWDPQKKRTEESFPELKIEDILRLPVEHETSNLRYVGKFLRDYGISLAELTNDETDVSNEGRYVAKIHRTHLINETEAWQIASIWFDNVPVMIVQAAGENLSDEVQHFIINRDIMVEFLNYVYSLQTKGMARKLKTFDLNSSHENLGHFYGHSIRGEVQRIRGSKFKSTKQEH